MELIRILLNLNNKNFGSIEKFRLVENRLKGVTEAAELTVAGDEVVDWIVVCPTVHGNSDNCLAMVDTGPTGS